ncbi:MAG: integrase family protein [Alphaproteobacteria bacterium]
MKKKITKRAVDTLRPGESFADTEIRGFVVRRLPSGRLSYGYRYTASGQRRWLAFQMGITPEQARKAAEAHAGRVALGENPLTEREEERRQTLAALTLNQVLDGFMEGRVRGRGLRTAAEMASLLDRHVRPKLGTRPVSAIKRLEIVALLDQIANARSSRSHDGKSRRVADKVLGVLRSALNWHATRDDEFRSPIVPGMAHTSIRELARDRILADDEVRLVWRALYTCIPEAFVRIVRTLLLSAGRLREISNLQWSEVEPQGKRDRALIVSADRVKTNVEQVIPITPALASLIGERAEDAGDFVFSTNVGYKAFSGFSKAKGRLDQVIANQRREAGLDPMPPWRLHDLRRTARSLMSRAGVVSDVAERVLGHAMPGVRGVYDRHAYLEEKRDALERLATLVGKITNPPAGNVVPLRAAE